MINIKIGVIGTSDVETDELIKTWIGGVEMEEDKVEDVEEVKNEKQQQIKSFEKEIVVKGKGGEEREEGKKVKIILHCINIFEENSKDEKELLNQSRRYKVKENRSRKNFVKRMKGEKIVGLDLDGYILTYSVYDKNSINYIKKRDFDGLTLKFRKNRRTSEMLNVVVFGNRPKSINPECDVLVDKNDINEVSDSLKFRSYEAIGDVKKSFDLVIDDLCDSYFNKLFKIKKKRRLSEKLKRKRSPKVGFLKKYLRKLENLYKSISKNSKTSTMLAKLMKIEREHEEKCGIPESCGDKELVYYKDKTMDMSKKIKERIDSIKIFRRKRSNSSNIVRKYKSKSIIDNTTVVEDVVNEVPETDIDFYELGIQFQDKGELKKANNCYYKLLETTNSDFQEGKGIHSLIACNLFKLKCYHQSIYYFSRSIAEAKGKSEGYLCRAIAYMNTRIENKTELALKDLSTSIEIEPKEKSYFERGKIYKRFKNKKSQELARKDFESALQFNKNEFLYHYYNGICLKYLKMYKNAIESFSDSLKIKENAGNALYHRGVSHFHLKNYILSQLDYEKALKLVVDDDNLKDKIKKDLEFCKMKFNDSQVDIVAVKNLESCFTCSISQDIFIDPVILIESEMTFEREFIVDWMKDNDSCPITRKKLTSKKFIRNIGLKHAAEEWKKNHRDNT